MKNKMSLPEEGKTPAIFTKQEFMDMMMAMADKGEMYLIDGGVRVIISEQLLDSKDQVRKIKLIMNKDALHRNTD